MVKVIYGTKGTGKTKQMLKEVNETVLKAKGNVVYLTDTSEHSLEIKHQVRYINTKDYAINSEDRLIGMLAGLISGNTDIEYIYIDGAARMSVKTIDEMPALYAYMGRLCEEFGVRFVVTVSAAIENIPDFIKQYIK